MSGSNSPLAAAYAFGELTLDLKDKRLNGPNGPIHLGRRAFAVLRQLVLADGQLVTKGDLFEEVWRDVIVSDSALTSVIKEIRRATKSFLEVDPIETVYGRGFRFRPAVQPLDQADISRAREKSASPSANGVPIKPSVAVLPFKSLSSGPDDVFLAEGIAEAVSVSLSRNPTLFVVFSSSGLGSGDAGDTDREMCREFGVRYLLTGSVFRHGDRIQVNVHLVDGIEGRNIWAERVEGTIADAFDLQAEVAASVALIIDSSIERAERSTVSDRPVSNSDSHDLYWRANALFRNWDRESMLEAISLTERVLEIEPRNAWASGLAGFCSAYASALRWVPDADAARLSAEDHWRTALASGGDDPFVLGYVAGTLVCLGGDMEFADRLIERALEIHPNWAATLFWGGWVDLSLGRMERSLERFEKALSLNPRSAVRPFMLVGQGASLLMLGKPRKALSLMEDTVSLLPDHPLALAVASVAAMAADEKEKAAMFVTRLERKGGAEAAASYFPNPQLRTMLQSTLEAMPMPAAS